MTPARHDVVHWRGARWLVTRILPRGRLEIGALDDPTVRWVVLEEQLRWDAQARLWLCNAYLCPLPGTRN